MKDLLLKLVFFIAVFLLPVSAHAENAESKGIVRYGLAMHGEPALKPDFDHFPYASEKAKKGGVIRHGEIGSFDSINPHIVMGKDAAGMNNVYGRLMARSWDEPFSLYPWIAEKVTLPEDRRWIIIHLNAKAEFEDKHPLRAEDVVFSFETLRDKGRPNFRNVYGLVEKVTVIDELTVRFDFKPEANRETAMIIAMMPVYAKHIWKDREFDKTTLKPFISSGPYHVKKVEPGRRIVYERIKDYWAENLPSLKYQYNFDEIVYDYFRDENIALEAFKAGGFDYRNEWDSTKWQSNYDFAGVKDGRVLKEAVPHKRPEWLRAFIYNTRRPQFEDINVRKALGFAFDFEWMNKTLFNYSFKRINSIYPNSELAATGLPQKAEKALLEPFQDLIPKDVFLNSYKAPITDGQGQTSIRANLKVADVLLKKAGWIVHDGKRVHEKTGEEFKFEILLQDPKEEKIALEFARNLKKLGVIATIRTVDSAQFFARLNDYDYDVTLYKWHSTLSPGSEQLFYWGSKFADTKGSRNYPGIKSEAVDYLANQVAEAKTRDELLTAAHALDRVVMWGYYFLPLYYDGTDKIAYWKPLQRPEYTSIYGPVLESWWGQTE